MSDSATNENLREGRGERGDFGKDQGVGMKKGWETKNLGDVCEVIAGQSPEGKFYNAEGKGMPFYQGKKDFGDKFIEAPTTWTTQTTKIAKEGDILMSVRAPVGPVNFATDEVCIGRGLAAIRSSDELNRDFLFYQLWHLQPEIAGREGAVFASINKAEIEALPLAYAPLAEQQRIVGLLDEASEGLATAKANAEKNLQNARALFESHLQSVFTQRGPGWVEKRIEEWCDSVMDCVNKTAPVVEEPTPFKMIRTTNVRNGRVDVSTVRFVTEETYKIWTRRQTPQKGDVILTREAPMGEVGMLLTDDKVFLGQRLVSYRANSAKLDNQFLLFALQSGDLQGQIHAKASGSTVQHMRVPDTKNLLLAAPPLTKQREVVSQLVGLHEETHHLARLYEQKLVALESLKKSLLHQAFTGEL